MKNIDSKTNIEIDGAVFTKEFVHRIKELQANNNEGLDDKKNEISEIIFFIASLIRELDEDRIAECAMVIGDLHAIAKFFDVLRYPFCMQD